MHMRVEELHQIVVHQIQVIYSSFVRRKYFMSVSWQIQLFLFVFLQSLELIAVDIE